MTNNFIIIRNAKFNSCMAIPSDRIHLVSIKGDVISVECPGESFSQGDFTKREIGEVLQQLSKSE